MLTKTIKVDGILEEYFRISTSQKKALSKMGIKKVVDLLYYFPVRYGHQNQIRSVESLKEDDEAVIFGKISKLEAKKTFRSHIPISTAKIEDSTGKIKLIWWREPYIAKMFAENTFVRIEGKVSEKNKELYISNPKIEKVSTMPKGTSDSLFKTENDHHLFPVYPESKNITSNWLYFTLQKIFKSGLLETLEDPIPQDILTKYNLPPLRTSMLWIHTPKTTTMAEVARKRFAFEEIFVIQLERSRERQLTKDEPSFKINKKLSDLKDFTDDFPFSMTNAQKRVSENILSDLNRGYAMSRLLEGDVGSGKTAVSAIAVYATLTTPPPSNKYSNLQIAYMAPTEILAEQHFESFIEYFRKHKAQIGLITGSGAKKFPSKISGETWTKISKKQLGKWVENGEISVLVGTHALIQKSIKFKNLGLIIIDEQHRFGVKQRMQLRRKSDIIPHLLSMTATPIPRSLALTIFGDLDLSLLDELPPNRQQVETKIVLNHQREEVYEKIKEQLNLGRQAYIICPRIEEPDPSKELALNTRSVQEEVKRLKERELKNFNINAITGKMSPKEKEETMKKFKDKKIDVLVATSVVEVGVNVPNATIMIIENAERFGLAQLHQLRGRILRSEHKPYCFVFAETKSKKTIDRLNSFVKAKNGFELAEFDLQQRGAGGLSGIKQWGISDLGMEALKNIKMVEIAREEATNLIEKDFDLKNYPLLASKLSKSKERLHLE